MQENWSPFSLKDKRILITGASSGIGRETAIRCSQAGAKVVLMGRDRNRLDETHSMMTGSDHLIYPCDLLDYMVVETKISQIVETVGRFDGLVNCAGISTTLAFSAVKPDKLDSFFKTNVIGALNLTRLVVKKENFVEKGGSIVFISSVMGVTGANGKSLYSITKGAIDAGVRSLSIEYAARKIRINSVSPGVVVTPMSKGAVYSQKEESLDKVKALHPLGLGSPSDVAYACIYLLSDAAGWVTGTNLIVDGGYTAR